MAADVGGVTVVVLSHNRPACLEKALASIVAQSHRPAEIVVVDNNSPASPAVASVVAQVPDAVLIRSATNLGFAGGMNLGISRAQQAYVFLTEDDVVLEPDCLARLLEHIVREPSAGLMSGIMIDANGGLVLSGGGHVRLGRIYQQEIVARGERFTGHPTDPYEVSYVPGAMIFASRKTWHVLGGFREDFFLYGEDVDLCFRALAAGYRITVVPTARVWHLATHGVPSEDVEYHRLKNFMALYLLHAPAWVFPEFLVRYVVLWLFRATSWTQRRVMLRALSWVVQQSPSLIADRGQVRPSATRHKAPASASAAGSGMVEGRGPGPRQRPDPHLRVAHIVPAAFGPGGVVGGAERYALGLARAMSTRVPVTLVTFADQDRHERDGALEIKVIGRPWYLGGQRTNPVSVKLVAALRDATVVHCHQQHILASSLAALYSRVRGRRVFVTDLGGGGWDISGYVSTDRWYHGHLHISEYSRQVFGHAANPRARVILGGVDTTSFAPDPAVSRSGEVVFVGRLLPHKGIDYLIEALPEDLPLRVIGAPGDARYAEDLCRLAAGKHVRFEPTVSDNELRRAYRSALCIVLPSVYRTMYGQETRVPELLGQTLLEGMACGTPALATTVASMPEVVVDGVTGFLVPPNDPAALREKLEWFRRHPVEGARIGAAARARVLERFTWGPVVDRCLAAYAP